MPMNEWQAELTIVFLNIYKKVRYVTYFLKLAIDGRNLSSPISGINRYILESICALSAKDISIEILHHSPIQPHFLRRLNAVNVKFRKTASRFGLPKYTQTDEQVFWAPAHRFPLGFSNSVPSVVTVHDLVWKKFAHTMRVKTYLGERLFFSRAMDRAEKIVCVSCSTANDLRHFFPMHSEKVEVIYPGAYAPSHRTRHKGKPFALFVGTIEPRKNLHRLLDAYAIMPQNNNLDLVIAGGKGWGDLNLEKKVAQHGLCNNIRIITQADDAMINQLYADCHFLIMPSLYEGFGLPLLEAMKYGKPVITSDIGSMPEVASGAGLFIDPNDTNQIALSMSRLICDQELYLNLSSAAIKRASYFSWSNSAQSLFQLFQKLLKN
jgi:glycosyltransferase involved in cell wall biosynthesis